MNNTNKYNVDDQTFATLEEAEKYVWETYPEYISDKHSFYELCENKITHAPN